MDIRHLQIANFLTIGTARLELDGRGLLLIQGENKDDPSAKSNGAGKSSIPDALCWAIYGVTARDVSGDAVVNKTAKKGCRVEVFIRDGDYQYRIIRHRKDPTHKNGLFVFQHSFVTGEETELTKGTERETQEVINGIMGCSLDVFQAAVYAGQEKMPDLPAMTDKQLKLLIEEAAGVEVLAQAYGIARDRKNSAEAAFKETVASRDTACHIHVRLQSELATQEGESKAFEDGRKDRAKAELGAILPIKVEIDRSKAELAGQDEAEIKNQLVAVQAKLDAYKAEQTELSRLEAAVRTAEQQVTRLRTLAENGKRNVETMERGLTSIKSRVGTPCGECGKPYQEEDLHAAAAAQQKSIDKSKEELRPTIAALKEAIENLAVADSEAKKFKASMTDPTEMAARQRDLQHRLSGIAGIKSDIDIAERNIAQIKERANLKLTETNPWAKAIEAKKGEIERAAKLAEELTEAVKKREVEVALLSDAVKVFGPAGVRAHILDTVTPFLNERTSDYLGALSDGNISATWATLTKNKNGELKEKFNIDVTNATGAESFVGLSGGEKRKVRLATAMALQDMVASRATKPINIFIADEVDHALDESGLERLMGVLDKKAKERGTVLVVSHNALSDWIDNVVTVKKMGGMATVDGAVSNVHV